MFSLKFIFGIQTHDSDVRFLGRPLQHRRQDRQGGLRDPAERDAGPGLQRRGERHHLQNPGRRC